MDYCPMLKVIGYKSVWVKKHSWWKYKKREMQPIYEDLGKGASRDEIWTTMHRCEKNLED